MACHNKKGDTVGQIGITCALVMFCIFCRNLFSLNSTVVATAGKRKMWVNAGMFTRASMVSLAGEREQVKWSVNLDNRQTAYVHSITYSSKIECRYLLGNTKLCLWRCQDTQYYAIMLQKLTCQKRFNLINIKGKYKIY